MFDEEFHRRRGKSGHLTTKRHFIGMMNINSESHLAGNRCLTLVIGVWSQHDCFIQHTSVLKRAQIKF